MPVELLEKKDAVRDNNHERFKHDLGRVLEKIELNLIEKNKSYSDSVLSPIRVFSKASTDEQIRVRLDDKLSRIINGQEYPGDNDMDDLIGYLIIHKVWQRRNEKEA